MRRLPSLLLLLAGAAAAQAPTPPVGEFSWRAPLQAPASGGLARAQLPGDALMHARSPALADLRVLDERGQLVPFAVRRPDAAAPAENAARAALYPLTRSAPPRAATVGGGRSLQVRLGGAGDDAVWVHFADSAAPADPLPSVLLDLREDKRVLTGLRIDGEWPANTPLRLRAFSSADLAEWQPVPLRGALYRFDGTPPLENRTLAFATPQRLEGRYLRLDWDADARVRIGGAQTLFAADRPPTRPSADLPAGSAQVGGLEWTLETTAAPVALHLTTTQANALLPVRVLGRREASQPWGVLSQTLVFRLGSGENEASNAPLPLAAPVPRYLRVEPLRGLPLLPLAARLEFEPADVVFLAAAGPLQLAIGRASTPAADVPSGTLAAALPQGRWDAVLVASIGPAQVRAATPSALPAWWPRSVTPATAALWGVLLAGVLALGAVAVRLLRQLKAPAAGPGA